MEAALGNSSEFSSIDGNIIYRMAIVGTASTTVKAFLISSAGAAGSSHGSSQYLKFSGLTNSGAYLSLQAKTLHADDDFSDTGRLWFSDRLKVDLR
jgi:hypothetical protein